MSSHVDHEIYLHLNGHTKLDVPILTGPLEELTHSIVRERWRRMKGVYFHEIMPPGLCMNDWKLMTRSKIKPAKARLNHTKDRRGTHDHHLKVVANTGRLKPARSLTVYAL